MFNFRRKLPWTVDTTPTEREEFYAEYGQIMRKARQEMEISLHELAQRLKINETALSEYECGKPIPFIDSIAIYQYLGMRQKERRHRHRP